MAVRAAWAWTTATTIVLGIVAFVASPIVAQALGPTGRGRLVVVQLAPQLLADLSSIGLGFAIVHYGAQRQSSVRTLLLWSVKPMAIGSIIMFAIGQSLAGVVAGGVSADERLMRWYLLLCPLTAFAHLPIESLRSLGHFKLWNVLILIRGLLWPVVLLLAVGVADDPIHFVVVVHLSGSVVLLVAVWVIALGRTASLDDDPSTTARSYVGYGIASASSTLPRSANAKLDQLLMTTLVSRDNLGVYAAAVGWSALTLPVIRGLSSVTMPHVSGSSDADRPKRVKEMVTAGLAAVVVLTGGGIVATLLLWGPLYGDSYRPALSAAVVLIPAALLLEFNAVLGNVLRSLGRPLLVTVLELTALVVSCVALLLVLSRSEVLGPALVSLGTYALATGFYVWAIARSLGKHPRELVDLTLLRQIKMRGGR